MAPCGLCNDLEKRDNGDPRLAFDFTPEDIVQAAYEDACDSCTVILEGLRQSETEEWSFQRHVRRVYARCHDKREASTESLRLEIYFIDDRPKLELEFYSLQPHAWRAILPRSSTSGHPLSPRALAWVRSLVEECKSEHVSCRDLAQSQLPKRVLSLHDHGQNNIFVKLVEPNGQSDSYAALSHCWGAEQSCTTLQSNISARKRGITWDEIPKTFQDAIRFALKLGMRYIWIDSLCIVQDDATDWQIQSSQMADIYSGASLTLSATASGGDSQGCYPETPREIDDLELHLPDDIGTCNIAVRRPLKHWNNMIPSQLQKRFPLLSRGWAFQERLLSPRVLHFCEAELVWECRQVSTCECDGLNQESSPGGTYYNAIKNSEVEGLKYSVAQQERLDEMMAQRLQQQEDDWEMALRLQNEDLDSGSDLEDGSWAAIPPLDDFLGGSSGATASREHINEPPTYNQAVAPDTETKEYPDLVPHFHHIVSQYSALSLTKQRDRLPALSGLCKRVQHLRGEYIAGLWSDSLCFDLMWRVNTLNLDAYNGGRPIEYSGPTWSWVSVESPVHYWDDLQDFEVSSPRHRHRESTSYTRDDIVEDLIKPTATKPLGRNSSNIKIQIDLPGYNPFGAVDSAVMTAEASYVPATLLYAYASYWHGQTNAHDPARYKLGVNTSNVRGGGVEIPFYADYALGLDGPHQVCEGETVTLLLVHPKVSLVLKKKSQEGRMVTVAAEKGREQAWERIGIARISEDLLNYYRVDWMRQSAVEKFWIV